MHRLLLDADPADVLHFLEGWAAAHARPDAAPAALPCRYQGQEHRLPLPLAPGELPVTNTRSSVALDAYLAARPQVGIDFIHGTDTLRHLSDAAGRIGFLLPGFPKDALFPYVAGQGVLPRKTFSMGTALEKRYYLEARMIRSDR